MVKCRLNNEFLEDFKNYSFSSIKEEKIFLVGSNSIAKDYFPRIESILQIKHKKLVSICSVDGLMHKDKFSEEEWEILQEIALNKLKNQEAILVLDVDNYIGSHSHGEIEYFENILRRPIYYLSKLHKIEK